MAVEIPNGLVWMTPHFWPRLSAVSPSLAAWVTSSCSRFGRNLPGLGVVGEGNQKSRSIGRYLTNPALSERKHVVQFDILTACH